MPAYTINQPNGSKIIFLDSLRHYQIRDLGVEYGLYEYPEECPWIDDREHFSPDEGVLCETWRKNEKIGFASLICESSIKNDFPMDVICGDDFIYEVKKNAGVDLPEHR